MKKIMSCIFLMYAVAASLEAQTPSVLASGGGTASSSEFQMSATVGQTTVAARISNAKEISPGFWPATNTSLIPVALYNSVSFGIMALQDEEVPFDLIISNSGNFPLDYEIRVDAIWEIYEWLTVSRASGRVAGGGRDSITVTVVETGNLQEGPYEGRLLITTNTGVGLSQVTDTVGVSLTVLAVTGAIASADTTIPAGDSPPVEFTDAAGNSLGITFDFSAGEGGTVSVTAVSTLPPSDSTTGFYDPDSLVTDPVYANFYWEISSTMPEGFVVDVTFNYAGLVGVQNPGQLRLVRRMNHAGPGVEWEFIPADSVVVDEADQTITALAQTGFSQWTVASDEASNSFEDTEAPVISALSHSPESPQVLEPVTVQATVTDESSVESVILHYLKGGDPSFQEVSMTGDGSGIYSGVIPADGVTLTGIAYTIRSVDQLGYGSNSDTLSAQVQFPAGALTTGITGSAYPDGLPRKKWRLVSVPAELDDPDVTGLFGAELKGKPGETTWKIYEWAGSDWANAQQVSPGKGYWLFQLVKEGVIFSSGAGRSVDLTGSSLALQPGWNLIGSPYAFVVDVVADQTQFYGPLTYGGSDGEGWSDLVAELLPWGGYIIYNRENSALTLNLQPLKQAGSLPRATHHLAGGLSEGEAGWKLQLQARGKTYSDVATYIGRLTGAQEQLDYRDNPEPPYIEGYVSLAMDRPEWSRNFGIPRFTSDIRSIEVADGTWDIDLHVRGETGPIRLTHDLAGELPPDFRIALLDLITREVYDIARGDDEIIITDYRPIRRSGEQGFPYHLKVVAGGQAYVDRMIDEILSMLPEKIALAQNYPNPFNPATRIPYALPKPQRVALKVYNILGQEVVTLVDGWQDLGHHEVIWNGRDRRGRNLPSGMYFSALHAEKKVLIRKMLIIK